MLTRQWSRHGGPLLRNRCSNPHLRPTVSSIHLNSSVWITDDDLSHAFRTFFRCFSKSLPSCDRNRPDLTKRRMSAGRLDSMSAAAVFDDTEVDMEREDAPPTFSWSRGLSGVNWWEKGGQMKGPELSEFPLPFTPPGADPSENITPRSFFNSLLFPNLTPFNWYSFGPIIPQFRSFQLPLASLEKSIREGDRAKSTRSLLSDYNETKAQFPLQRLKRDTLIIFCRKLLQLRMNDQLVDLLEKEGTYAIESVEIIRAALENEVWDERERLVDDLIQSCVDLGRMRLAVMFMTDLNTKTQPYKLPLNSELRKERKETGKVAVRLEKKDDVTLEEVVRVRDVTSLMQVVERIETTGKPVSMEISRAVFQRLVELGELGKAVDLVPNSLINISGSSNIATICEAFISKDLPDDSLIFFIRTLKLNRFGLLTEIDVRQGARSVGTSQQLVTLWELLKITSSVQLSQFNAKTRGYFLGRAARLKLGTPWEWRLGDGETPLLKMCIEVIIQASDEDRRFMTDKISTMIESWVWNWKRSADRLSDDLKEEAARVDTKRLDYPIPYLSRFFDVLPQDVCENAITLMVRRVTTNCRRAHNQIWPRRVLWPFVASIAHCDWLWKSEQSPALYVVEKEILRKNLAHDYLAFRSDEEIARFVARHYLPFRMAIRSPEGIDQKNKEEALDILHKLQNLEKVDFEGKKSKDSFAMAILAFKKTSIATDILLLDMIYTLHRLGRPEDIVHTLQVLLKYKIKLPYSDLSKLIRTLTPTAPACALDLLKLQPGVQYSTYAAFIATTALENPALALAAYRQLTRPNVYPFTPDQPRLAPRRLAKRRLLEAMAWKFANSPKLTSGQAIRYVTICYRTMMALNLPPGPKMGMAIGVGGIKRRIKEGLPVGLEWKRTKWGLEKVRKLAGKKKEIETEMFVKTWRGPLLSRSKRVYEGWL